MGILGLILKILMINILFSFALFIIQGFALFLNTNYENKNTDKDFFMYRTNNYKKINFIVINLLVFFQMKNLINNKMLYLMILTYLLFITLVNLIFIKKIKVKISNELLEVEKLSVKQDEPVFNLELNLGVIPKKNDIELKPEITITFNLVNKKGIDSYYNSFHSNVDNSFNLLSKIINCKNIKYNIKSKDYKTFDEAFIKMIEYCNIDKTIVKKKKNELKKVYQEINPYGRFENLNIFFNY